MPDGRVSFDCVPYRRSQPSSSCSNGDWKDPEPSQFLTRYGALFYKEMLSINLLSNRVQRFTVVRELSLACMAGGSGCARETFFLK